MSSVLSRMKNLSARTRNIPGQDERGMTLIEIMIVIAIIAGLMAVLGSNVMNSRKKAQVEQTKMQIKELGKQLEAYNLSCNSYPTSEQGLKRLDGEPWYRCLPRLGSRSLREKESAERSVGHALRLRVGRHEVHHPLDGPDEKRWRRWRYHFGRRLVSLLRFARSSRRARFCAGLD